MLVKTAEKVTAVTIAMKVVMRPLPLLLREKAIPETQVVEVAGQMFLALLWVLTLLQVMVVRLLVAVAEEAVVVVV
jgi:hypothetical protein